MQKEKFISGMNGHIVLSPRERERIIQRSVEREHWKTKSTICMEEMAEALSKARSDLGKIYYTYLADCFKAGEMEE